MNESIFEKKDKEALKEFISYVAKYFEVNQDEVYEQALKALKYYSKAKSEKEQLRSLQTLENKWYESLKNNSPDFSIYESKDYIFDIWACWIIYSRKYLLSIKKVLTDYEIENVKSVVDLGCGFGYTTAGLKEIFSNAKVYGLNIETSYQFKIAQELAKEYDLTVISNSQLRELNKIDLVFASEYFEHIENPIEHLIKIIEVCKPNYFIVANSFNTISIGHFKEYKHNNQYYEAKKLSRMFNQCLKSYGYESIKTKLWNNRPSFYKYGATTKTF